ncbi:hypothetical protein ACFYQ5_19620 [Streptomyces sp. NPDC005794]|uniref:hypothetical protein n=1 Tax=Streptomyces sp. NPDC005794 TaxID=3364733 RepID=UPI0036C183B8
MTRRPPVRLFAWAALAAAPAFALLAVAVLNAPPGLLPGDAALHHWSQAHRPGAALALSRAVTATGTGVIPFAVVVLAGLSVGGTTRQRLITAAALAALSRHRPGVASRGHVAGCPTPAAAWPRGS